MNTNQLKHYVLNIISISDHDLEKFCNLFIKRKVARKKIILHAGDISSFEAFVTRGLFKIFHIDENGTEQILYFAAENWWLADLDSFNNQQPSQLFIEAIEDSEILCISRVDKEYAFKNIISIERLFRIMTQRAHVSLQRRIIENMSSKANQRYINFAIKYPYLVRRLTNVQIAAYLGISHEFVSRIRQKIIRGNLNS
jgi:CRP-like cAMP-binding protein